MRQPPMSREILPRPGRLINSRKGRTFAQLELIQAQFIPPIDLLCPIPEGILPKSWAVYVHQYFQQHKFAHLRIRLGGVKDDSKEAVLSILSRIGPKGPAAAAATPIANLEQAAGSDLDKMELWAKHCLETRTPLEDVIIANDGQVPDFPPHSLQGQVLLQRARGG